PVDRGVPPPRPRASDPPAELHLLRRPHRAAAAGAGLLGRALGDVGRLTSRGDSVPSPVGQSPTGPTARLAALGRARTPPPPNPNGCSSIDRPKTCTSSR